MSAKQCSASSAQVSLRRLRSRYFAQELRAGVATLLLAALWVPAAQASGNDLKSRFLSPPQEAKPWFKSTWTGGNINTADVRASFQALEDAGIGGAVMEFPVFSLVPRPTEEWSRINSYGTPVFWGKFADALAVAKQLDFSVDTYLGSCMPPSGGFAIPPELAAVELTFSRQEIAGGTVDPKVAIPTQPPRNGTLLRMIRPTPPGQEVPPEWAGRLAARQRIVAVLAVQGSGPDIAPMGRAIFGIPDHWGVVLRSGQLKAASTLNLTDRLQADGQLKWTAPAGTWQVFVFRQAPTDTVNSCGAGEGPQFAANPFDHRAFDALKAWLFDPNVPRLQPYFGNALRGYMIDSSEFPSDIFWTDDFLEQFRHRRGYDLTPYLPFVFQPGWMMHPYQARYSAPMFQDGDVGERVRSDYRLTVAELMTENYYQPFADLMKANGLTSRLQAHGAPVDILKVYGLATIPETEDLHVGPDPYFMRMARAAADVYGRSLISSESLIFGTGGPSVTPLQMKDHIDLLLLAGVNQIRIDGFNAPASLKAAAESPSPAAGLGAWIGSDQSTWPFIRTLAAYIGRSQAVLQEGHNVVSLAVFRPDPTYVPASASDDPKTEPEPGFIAGLQAAGYDYDQISDDGIARSKVLEHRLVAPGGATYNGLVVPETASLRTETAAALRRFAEAGLPVLFVGRTPHRYAGLMNYATRDAEVRNDVAAALHSGARATADYDVTATLTHMKVAPNLDFLNGSSAPFLERAVGALHVFLFRNPDDGEKTLVFRTRVVGGAELWDPWTGGVEKLSVDGAVSGDVVSFKLAPHETRLVIIDPQGTAEAGGRRAREFEKAQAERPSPVLEIGTGGWALHASGRGQDDRAISADLKLKRLTDWTTMPELRDLSGEGHYTTTFEVDPAWLRTDRQYWLDLGEVNDAAVVQINGRAIPAPLAMPHRVDITGALKPGQNTLVVSVVNTPNNSFAASAPGAYGLRPAGLAGPVWLKIGPLLRNN